MSAASAASETRKNKVEEYSRVLYEISKIHEDLRMMPGYDPSGSDIRDDIVHGDPPGFARLSLRDPPDASDVEDDSGAGDAVKKANVIVLSTPIKTHFPPRCPEAAIREKPRGEPLLDLTMMFGAR